MKCYRTTVSGMCLLISIMSPMCVGAQGLPENITLQGNAVIVGAGTHSVLGKTVTVNEQATFSVEPGDLVAVENEAITLSPSKPESWGSGTRLAGPNAKDINALGSFDRASLVIRKSAGGAELVAGKDYQVGPDFGMVGIGPSASVTSNDQVFASYRYGLLRLDAVYVDKDGHTKLAKGTPHVSAPLPAAVPEGATRLLNIFRGYRSTTVSASDLFPILESADVAVTKTTAGLVPKTLEKLKSGQPVHIVALGDSVTAGGNASTPEMAYPEQFHRMLQAKFPSAAITVTNISYGGTNSSQWLRLGPLKDYFTQHPEMPADQINFDRVVAAKPDLVTIEFVNDSGWDNATLELLYGEMLKRLQAIGAEIILITPHYANFDAKRTSANFRDPDTRPYVAFLFDFANRNKLAVADASSRWAHLWKEGIPYVTLLDNTVNHPDDRGHKIFAEELLKCFGQ